MGTVSALVRGSPDDAEESIKAQAAAAKADYYVIIMIDETIITDSGIHRLFCTVNNDLHLNDIYTALRP